MDRVEFVTPWVKMRADQEHMHKWKYLGVVNLEPFAPRHSITFFNNNKREKRAAEVALAYDRLHGEEVFDPRKARAERTNPSLIWSEIYEENKRHIIPMTTSHSYGRPNRVQIDYPDNTFRRATQTREFYRRNDLNLVADEVRQHPVC
ncbi:hypothetical protein KPH14_006332 [Odynerus spinipes]|uniref:Uncharacterized protein n=1 Tax=Odynerus spinipes TaxID=1348599 RepID=A0AAD9VVI2_9HYME|nr:hypothetical protein KPH14_006332 [Odynerus spinipes]